MRNIINSAITAAVLMSSPALAEQVKGLQIDDPMQRVLSSSYKSNLDIMTPYTNSKNDKKLTLKELVDQGTGVYFDTRSSGEDKVNAVLIELNKEYTGTGEYSLRDLKQELKVSPHFHSSSRVLRDSVNGVELYGSVMRDIGGEDRMLSFRNMGRHENEDLANPDDNDFFLNFATLRSEYIDDVYAKSVIKATDPKYALDVAPYLKAHAFVHELDHTSIDNVRSEYQMGVALNESLGERMIQVKLTERLLSEISSDVTPLGLVYTEMLKNGLNDGHINAFSDGLSAFRISEASRVSNYLKRNIYRGGPAFIYDQELDSHQSDMAVMAYTAIVVSNLDKFSSMNPDQQFQMGRDVAVALIDNPEVKIRITDDIAGVFESLSYQDREKIANDVADEIGAKYDFDAANINVEYSPMPDDLAHKVMLRNNGFDSLEFKEGIEFGPMPPSYFVAGENSELEHAMVINMHGAVEDSKFFMALKSGVVPEGLSELVKETDGAYVFNENEYDLYYIPLDNVGSEAQDALSKLKLLVDKEEIQPMPLDENVLSILPSLDYYSWASSFRYSLIDDFSFQNTDRPERLVDTLFEKPGDGFDIKKKTDLLDTNEPEPELKAPSIMRK